MGCKGSWNQPAGPPLKVITERMKGIEMTNREPEHRTTVINTGRSGSGAGWFIVGGLVVLALVGIWLFAGGVFDRSTTASIDVPDEVQVEMPDVDVEVAPAQSEADAPAEPAPEE